MGHHYVPQRYLENFQCRDRPGFIWLHDKHTGEAREVAIKQAAQTRGFYSPDVEELLGRAVEAPTYPVIDRLLLGRPVAAEDRHQLALFIGTMMMRVPAHRRKLLAEYPGYVADYCKDARADVEQLADTLPDVRPEFRVRVLDALDRYEREFVTSPSPEVVEQIESHCRSGTWLRSWRP